MTEFERQTLSEHRAGMIIDWDVSIAVDDGLVLKADVFRPQTSVMSVTVSAEQITVLHYGQMIVEGDRNKVVNDPMTREIYLGH